MRHNLLLARETERVSYSDLYNLRSIQSLLHNDVLLNFIFFRFKTTSV